MKTNSLTYSVTKLGVNYHGEKADIIVKIRLNDECKNGHQNFAITADIYKEGHRTDRAHICGGCCHEEIVKYFPKFKIFVALHLADFNGAPMYAVENGFYHLKEGFNSKSSGEEFKREFCEYYRMTPAQFDEIKDSEDSAEFSILLKDLGIIEQWKAEAEAAIKILEGLTGDEFLNDSTRSQYTEPTPENIEGYKRLKSEGYYTIEAKNERAKVAADAKRQKQIKELKESAQGKIDEINIELNVKLHVIESGLGLDNVIYYNHAKELVFNWQNTNYSKMVSENDFNYFVENADYSKLPEGIKISKKY